MTDLIPLRVTDLRPTNDEAIKPSELIRVTGHQGLSLAARRAITILWHRAHQQGIEEGKDYRVELADLRTDGHKGGETLRPMILSLMQTVVSVRLPNGQTRSVQILGGNDMDDDDRNRGVLVYSFDKRLVAILKESAIWGKIAIPVLMSFSSKYTISLYENVSQWINLNRKSSQEFSLEAFRDMLGVEETKYPAFGAFNKHVLKPVSDEINALAEFNVRIVPVKEGRRVATVRLHWWKKNEDELREAYAENERARVGRRARISGRVEYIAPIPSVSKAARRSRLAASPNSSLFQDE
jgi:hypothetical protein